AAHRDVWASQQRDRRAHARRLRLAPGRIARTAPEGRWRAHAAADGRYRQRRAGLYTTRASDAADTRALPPRAYASRPLETNRGDRGLPDACAAQSADHSVSGSTLLAPFPGGAVVA